jgi:hypothetical protein
MSLLVRVPLGTAAFIAWLGVAFGSYNAPPPDDALGPSPDPVAEYPLTGTSLYEGEILAMPSQVAVVGDRIVLVDGFAERPVHVLDAASGIHVASFGRSGKGPGEFEWPRAVESAGSGSHSFWVFDAALSRLTLVEPDIWASQPSSERITLSVRGPAQVTNVIRIGENRLLGAGFFSDGRLGHFDGKGDYTGASGPLPVSATEAPPGVLQHAYRGVLKSNPARTRLVFANRHAGFLEIYGSDGEPLRRIDGPYEFEPSFTVRLGEQGPGLATGDDLRFGYVDVATTNDRIYALFSGRTRTGHPEDAVYGQTVHVFDWDGTFVSILHLDADVMAIAVDEVRTRLLAVRHVPAPAVLSYDLPARLQDRWMAVRAAD